ncbi:MAG: PAS domain-containing sensor histidine kinase, partial [Myxococcales bacterium]|nr:PAS domain-containing sensor histidine kinase [Myxococcales bacterium]
RLAYANAACDGLDPSTRKKVGGMLSDVYPRLTDAHLPEAFASVLETGRPRQLDPIEIADTTYAIDLWRVGPAHVGVFVRLLPPREEAETQLVAYGDDLFWVHDPRTRTLQYLSPAFERLIGIPRAQAYLDPRAWIERVHPDDRGAFEAHLAWADEDGDHLDFRLVRPNGEVRWLNSSARPMRRAGRPVYRVVGTARDVTASKRVELRLRRSNEDLEAFAYVASHDLRTPLRGMENLTRWLTEDAHDPQSVREHTQLIEGRVKRMSQLLDDLLAYARVGTRPQRAEPVDLPDLFRRVVRRVNPPAGIEVAYDGPDGTIEVESRALRDVLAHLVSNAVRHHDRDVGRVDVRLALTHGGRQLSIQVADDGPGILPKFHDRVFRLFETLRPRDDVEGSGVGLAMVRRHARHRGGDVQLHSDGRGTTVDVQWPLPEPADD